METHEYLKSLLLDMLLKGKSLNSLCDYVENHTGYPMAVCIPFETIIAMSKGYTQDMVREFVNGPKGYSLDKLMEFNRCMDEVYSDNRAHVVKLDHLTEKRVLCTCSYENERVAALDIVVLNREPDSDTIDFVSLVASYVPLFLKVNGFLIGGERHLSINNFILGILNGTITNTKEVLYSDKSRFFGIKCWRLVWVPLQRDPELTERKLAVRRETISRICRNEYNWWTIDGKGVGKDGDIILLDDDFFGNISVLNGLCEELACRAYVSGSFSNLLDMTRVFEELQFMELTLFVEETDRKVCFYEDNLIYLNLASAYLKDPGSVNHNSILSRIVEYDSIHGTDYYLTLETFFVCHGDNKLIAKKLFIHGNTSMYRLRRLTELFGIEFGDYGTMSDLYYSLQLRKLESRLGRMKEMHADPSDPESA